VDKCVDVVKKNSLTFEGISHYPDLQKVHINNICHVHGSLGRPIIFAVNDESQIANPDIFNCPNGNIYHDLFIKRNANAAYKENNDITALEMLKESDIICIYGMSIGPTDGIWWERICDWLVQDSKHKLIIFEYGLPNEDALPVKYLIAVDNIKEKILQYSKNSAEKNYELAERIYVTGENVFDEIKNLKDGLISKYKFNPLKSYIK
jgi:hypothetical protein